MIAILLEGVQAECSTSAPFFGMMGITCAIVFSSLGSAYGIAKSGVGIASMGVMNPNKVMKNIIPVVMAGILSIYGLILCVILYGAVAKAEYTLYEGFAHLGAGISQGVSALASGMAIGVVGDSGVRANGQQPKLFVSMVLILVFAEAIGLFGLIVGILVGTGGAPYACGWDV